MKIKKLLTDNGTQFTDRFTSNKKDKDGKSIPTGWHDFDQACTDRKIERRLIPPHHPQTNGMVERLNGSISEIVQQTRFASSSELQ
jgi:transposase InsO family protein